MSFSSNEFSLFLIKALSYLKLPMPFSTNSSAKKRYELGCIIMLFPLRSVAPEPGIVITIGAFLGDYGVSNVPYSLPPEILTLISFSFCAKEKLWNVKVNATNKIQLSFFIYLFITLVF